jgi:tRNA(Ile)-lysidine synthase
MAGTRKSRSTNAVENAVAACLARHVRSGEQLLLALSGGIDSVVLLDVVRRLGHPLSAIHVHHGLSENADQWAQFCSELCSGHGLDLRVERVTVDRSSPDGLEAAARRARHQRLQAVAADWLLLAHHGQDRAETVLFNLLRGAGVRGAGAMRESAGRLLRPLLLVGREEVLDYATAAGLSWIEDESNADTRYSRNYLRHRVLPIIESRFPAAAARLANAAARFAEASDLLDDLATIDLGTARPEFPVAVELLRRLAEPRARNVLRFLLDQSGTGIPSEERLTEALRQVLDAAVDRHPAINFGVRTLRRRGRWIELE